MTCSAGCTNLTREKKGVSYLPFVLLTSSGEPEPCVNPTSQEAGMETARCYGPPWIHLPRELVTIPSHITITQSHRALSDQHNSGSQTSWKATELRVCYSINMKCSSIPHSLVCWMLGPQMVGYLGRSWKLQEVGPSWRKLYLGPSFVLSVPHKVKNLLQHLLLPPWCSAHKHGAKKPRIL
jgi:hypothetical protein